MVLKNNPNLFTDDFISGQQLYHHYTGQIASFLYIRKVNCEQVRQWLKASYEHKAIARHHKKDWTQGLKSPFCREEFILLSNYILVNLDAPFGAVLYYSEDLQEEAEKLSACMRPFLQTCRQRKKPEYNMITNGRHGYDLVTVALPPKKIDVQSHYNDDLLEQEPQLQKMLNSKTGKGLHLFHGLPGTGKSTYLRHLIGRVRTKDFIFLSPHLAGTLDSPQLISVLLQHPNSILIIEDAEALLVSRDNGRHSGLSFLLNLTDGLLGESLNIQVICTFNTQVNAIDKALLRKGRLKTLYEFKPLAVAKAQRLSEKVSGKCCHGKAATLAEIYNGDAANFAPIAQRIPIGFNAVSA